MTGILRFSMMPDFFFVCFEHSLIKVKVMRIFSCSLHGPDIRTISISGPSLSKTRCSRYIILLYTVGSACDTDAAHLPALPAHAAQQGAGQSYGSEIAFFSWVKMYVIENSQVIAGLDVW